MSSFTIEITRSGDQLNTQSRTIMVPRSPMQGSNLPTANFQNKTSLNLTLTFSTSPFTKPSHEIVANGTATPTWLGSVAAQSYPFTVAETPSKMKDSVRPANGDLNIQVQS